MSDNIPDSIVDMLNSACTDTAVFPPTILYNEGWMLRLVLSAGAEGIMCLPFSFLPDSKWFSEALLYSPFLARYDDDNLAETHSHADGVIGHFTFTPETKTGLELVPDSKQLIVIEAKMYSSLSKGTKNAPFYDQAARTVACMATTIERAQKLADDLESIGFYVVAPNDRINQGIFSKHMNKSSITEKVWRRVEAYHEDSQVHRKLQTWFRDVFDPLIKRIDLRCWAWETSVDAIAAAKPAEGKVLEDFYRRCLNYNKIR